MSIHSQKQELHMKVFDLQADQEKLYFVCLEDWSNELAEAGPHKKE